jgi:hypothetical protein
MKSICILKIMYSSCIWVFSVFCLIGQDRVDLIAGIGFPEQINAGARLQFNQSQVGGSIGYGGSSTFSFRGDFTYHFGNMSNLSSRRKWYVRPGLCFLYQNDESEVSKFWILAARIGREFNINENIGFSVDAGLLYILPNDKKETTSDNGLNFNFDLYVLPSLGFNFYFAL